MEIKTKNIILKKVQKRRLEKYAKMYGAVSFNYYRSMMYELGIKVPRYVNNKWWSIMVGVIFDRYIEGVLDMIVDEYDDSVKERYKSFGKWLVNTSILFDAVDGIAIGDVDDARYIDVEKVLYRR